MPDLDALRTRLHELAPVVVAFSGGADSSFLAHVAHQTLGPDRARCVTAVSPSLAGFEEDDCRALASEWGLRWTEVATDEMANAAYRRNDGDRCFWCKDALMDALEPLAAADEATVVLGVNLDDLGDHRPGQHAAARRGAAFPLVDAGFTKADVREASRRLELRTWDKPAAACLASRVPYGTPVDLGVLDTVERAETASARARLPRPPRPALPRPGSHRGADPRAGVDRAAAREVVAAVHDAGYRYVTLDLEGLRSGNLNQGLEAGGRS